MKTHSKHLVHKVELTILPQCRIQSDMNILPRRFSPGFQCKDYVQRLEREGTKEFQVYSEVFLAGYNLLALSV